MKKILVIWILFVCPLQAQWISQSLPNGGTVICIAFANSYTGFATCQYPNAVFKTTNGGINWVVFSQQYFGTMQFLDSLYGYATDYYNGGYYFKKTTNGGQNWVDINYVTGAYDFCFVNRDTGWFCGITSTNVGGVWWTINGGQSLQLQMNTGTSGQHIFISKQKINGQYYGWYSSNDALYKTTNSGINWIPYVNLPLYAHPNRIKFVNENTGWVGINTFDSTAYIIHTTNNGTNWIVQNLPQPQVAHRIYGMHFFNALTGIVGSMTNRNFVTTNGGDNWAVQSISSNAIISIFFIDSLNGWCGGDGMFRTTNGGIISGLQHTGDNIPNSFSLSQNYPNPFNPVTKIKFDVPASVGTVPRTVRLIIYDILGREVTTLVNESLKPGSYESEWDGSNFASGLYFYKLQAGDFIETKKMVLIK